MTSSGGVSHTTDCQMLPTERPHDIFDRSGNMSGSSVTCQPIILSYKCIVCCAVRATGSGAVWVTADRYVTPMSSHCHCDTNLYICRAGGERAVRFTAILIWNYYCDHFVFVATITDSAPHDVNQITGRGQVTWVLMTLRREVQDFWRNGIQNNTLKGINKDTEVKNDCNVIQTVNIM